MFQVAPSRTARFLSVSIISAICVLIFSACQSDEEKREAFFAQGEAYVEEDKLPEAIIEFKNVLKIDPNDADAHFQLAEAYLNLGRARDSYWEMSETVRLDPTNLKARLSFGALSLIARDFEQALSMGEIGMEQDPGDAKPYILAGRSLVALKRHDEAEPMYLKAVELEADSKEYLLTLATYYADLPDGREKAEPWFNKGIELFGGFQTYTALAKFLVRDPKRIEEAEAAFIAALGRRRDNKHGKAAFINVARFYFATKRPSEAVEYLEKGISKIDDKAELMYMLASYYRVQGDRERTEQILREAALETPEDATAYLTLSAYLGGLGDTEAALGAADDALKADPESIPAQLRRGEILIDMGFREVKEKMAAGDESVDPASDPRIAEGLQIVDAILAKSAFHPQAQFVRGKGLLAQGKTEAGTEALRAAAEGKPDWAEAHFALGSALASLNETSMARISIAKALELNPKMIEARRILSAVHQQLGEHEYAIEQGRLYLAVKPDHNPTRILVAQSLVRLGKRDKALRELNQIPVDQRDVGVYFAIGRIKMNLGQTDEARKDMIAASDLSPNSSKILRTLFRMDRMYIDKDESRFIETEGRIKSAVEADPDDGNLVQLRGMVYFVRGDLEAAEEAFVRATVLNPDDIAGHQQLARFYTMTGRADETIETYKKAIEVHPDSAKLHHFLALLYENQGQTANARASYENAIKNDENHGHAKNNLAYLMADASDDLDRALDLAQDAKALLPDSPHTADTLGWVLYKRGVHGAAVGYLKEAADSADPDDAGLPVIRHHLAQAYEADGNLERALGALEMAVSDIDRMARQAKAAGRPVVSRPWETDIREMLKRLSTAS